MLQLNLRIKTRKLIQLALALLRLHQDLILYALKTSLGWYLLHLGAAILLHHRVIISSDLKIGRALLLVH
jgi:hypothetical protein